ncbi:MAG: histidine ammonia-lyase [Clostridiaceae bacterium]
MKKVIFIDGDNLSIEDVVEVARHGAEVQIAEAAKEKMIKSRDLVERLVKEEKPIYGINTGFGSLQNVAISREDLDELQKNLIFSDAVGIGRAFDTEVSRAIMLLRVNAVAKGFSGLRVGVAQTFVDMLNKGVTPQIREKGSVGSSGDLCPLAHMVLVPMGEGEAEYQGKIMDGKSAMEAAGIPLITLKAKEGLALINGTCAMMGNAVLALYDSIVLMKSADIAASFTVDALEGVIDAFDPRVHNARPHKGQIAVANNIRRILEGSRLATRQGELRVQDAYSLRCAPQIHGGSRPAIEYVKSVIEVEINSATDNPLVFAGENEAIISGGNFHGQPVAIAMDTLGIAIAELADVSERRIERMVNPDLSNLPAFLVKKPGLNCGFMVPQYAAAAVVSENKILAHPASVDSIPTCGNQEDHVSMGTIAARKAREIVKHVQYVLGIELLCAAQAVDFKDSAKLGKGTSEAYKAIREKVTFMESDRIIYPDMDKAAEIVSSGLLVKVVEKAVGELE